MPFACLGGTLMRVLQVIPSIAPEYGGPASLLQTLLPRLQQCGVTCDVLTTHAVEPCSLASVCVHSFKRAGLLGYFAPLMRPWLRHNIAHYDAVHVRAAFNAPTLLGAAAAARRGVPIVFQPQGTLDAWSLQHHAWRKHVSTALFERPILASARTVQVSSPSEQLAVERVAWLRKAERILIPPLIPEPPQRTRRPESGVVLYASRLHAKKNFSTLAQAVGMLDDPNVTLWVAGTGSKAELASARDAVSRAGIDNQVHWFGHLGAKQLSELYHRASVFVLPSKSENFGMAVIEALAHGLPVIATSAVAAAETPATLGLVRRVSVGAPAPLAEQLAKALNDDAWRKTVAKKGPVYVSRNFGPMHIANRYREMYHSAIARHQSGPT